MRAKAAVPVAGRPLIHRIIAWLASYGVGDLVLNLHHRPETITREVGDGSGLGVRVRYSWEDPILGSAGGPRRALPIVGAATFFIINGDTLTDLDLHAMWRAHASSGAQVTLALIPSPKPDHYGGVIVDASSRVVRFVRRGVEPTSYHFIGVQIASASVFAPLAENRYADSIGELYPALMARDPSAVGAFVTGAEFLDVGSPRDYLETALRVADREGARARLLGTGTTVDPSAVVADSVLWDNVTVPPRCRLVRSIVTDGVTLPPGTTFEDRVVVLGAGGELNAVSLQT